MTIKIKIFLSFLGLTAVFLVFLGFKNLKVDLNLKPDQANINPFLEKDADWDNDGLSNREESYWNTDPNNPDTDGDGYLDGEEVSSGHDPKVPGPDDLLDQLNNLTNNLADLITAGLYAKDLTQNSDDQEFNKSVDNLSLSVISDFYGGQLELPENPLITLTDNTESNQINYLNEISEIIKESLLDFPRKIDLNKIPAEQIDFFLAKAEQYKIAYNQILSLSVPKDWANIHKQVLDIINRLHTNYLNIGLYNTDPLKSILALNETQNINNGIKLVLEEIALKIKANKLPLNNNFYEILTLIYQ